MDVINNFGTYNRSILAIPAFWGMSWLTHWIGITVASRGNPAKWDNRNPRAAGMKKKLQDTLPPDVYAKYERAEAASANGFENLPLFAAAVILGNVAKLPAAEMDRFARNYLAIRFVYLLVYVYVSKQQYTGARSIIWLTSCVMCINVMVKAAKIL